MTPRPPTLAEQALIKLHGIALAADVDNDELNATVELLRAALRAQPAEGPRWEPIATAPETTIVQVIDMTAAGPVPLTATHPTGRPWSTIPGQYNIKPTHWMPLPPAPGGAKE